MEAKNFSRQESEQQYERKWGFQKANKKNALPLGHLHKRKTGHFGK